MKGKFILVAMALLLVIGLVIGGAPTLASAAPAVIDVYLAQAGIVPPGGIVMSDQVIQIESLAPAPVPVGLAIMSDQAIQIESLALSPGLASTAVGSDTNLWLVLSASFLLTLIAGRRKSQSTIQKIFERLSGSSYNSSKGAGYRGVRDCIMPAAASIGQG